MTRETYAVRLLEKEPRVEDIVSFRFERPSGYEYEAGQWLVITLPVPGGTHHISHSSSPLDPVLEITTRLRGTEFKDALASLPLGAEVEIEGPYGSFVLPPDAERVAFLTGGIGVTCVRSILRWLGQAGTLPTGLQELVLLAADTSERSIAFRKELDGLQRVLPLRVVRVLSQAGTDWKGRRGHIDEGVLKDVLQRPEGWLVYVSGPPSMVRSIRDVTAVWGVDPAALRLERFEGYD